MKKILFVVAAIALIGSGLSAADLSGDALALKATVEGNASFTFGANLDPTTALGKNFATGIANASGATVKITLISKRSHTEKGEGETFAEITLADIETIAKNDKAGGRTFDGGFGDITAKIYLGPIFINVLGGDNKVDQAKLGMGYTAGYDGNTTVVLGVTSALDNELAGEFKGFQIGLKDTSAVKLTIGLNSFKDWKFTTPGVTGAITVVVTDTSAKPASGTYIRNAATGAAIASPADGNTTYATYGVSFGQVVTQFTFSSDTDNEGNIYQVYVSVGLGDKIVEGLTFDVAANVTTAATNNYWSASSSTGLGVSASYKIVVADGYTLKVGAGYDLKLVGTGSLADSNLQSNIVSQFGAGLGFNVPGAELVDKGYFGVAADKTKYQPGIAFGFSTILSNISVGQTSTTVNGDWMKHDWQVSFYDADLIPVLDLVALVEYNGGYNTALAGAITQGNSFIGIRAGATVDILTVYAEYWQQDTDISAFANAGSSDSMKLKVGVDLKPFALTTFSLAYTSGNFLTGTDAANSRTAARMGTVELTAKVSF